MSCAVRTITIINVLERVVARNYLYVLLVVVLCVVFVQSSSVSVCVFVCVSHQSVCAIRACIIITYS